MRLTVSLPPNRVTQLRALARAQSRSLSSILCEAVDHLVAAELERRVTDAGRSPSSANDSERPTARIRALGFPREVRPTTPRITTSEFGYRREGSSLERLAVHRTRIDPARQAGQALPLIEQTGHDFVDDIRR